MFGGDTPAANLSIVGTKPIKQADKNKSDIIQVQDQPPSLFTPQTGADTGGRFGSQDTNNTSSLFGNISGTDGSNRQSTSAGAGEGQSISGSGGAGAAAVNAQDVGEFLTKSSNSGGIDIQQRNAISSDPRVRGYRVGQLVTLGDGAFFFPVRQDLDTAISKFDPSTIRDVVVFRGPYTSMYGPGLAFLDVATFDSPRYECGFEAHGRTGVRYQTNGQRWDGLQSFSFGEKNWGGRITYDFLQGSDYEAGGGILVPGAYLSNNVNLVLGFDINDKSSIEFKAIRLQQNNVEYPGLYFDIQKLDTEAYSVRYTLKDQPGFDKFTFDGWYNSTTANGFTALPQKQAFVRQLLDASFNPDQDPRTQPRTNFFNQFTDQSTSYMSNKSMGYRAAMWWGKDKNSPTLVVGTDLNVLGQNLVENINFTQIAGDNINTGEPISPNGPFPTFTQRQTIPNASQTNPGLFTELKLPFGESVVVRTGGRIDYVNSTSGSRLITGNINVFGPPQIFPPFGDNPTTVDPLQYSTDPNNPNTTRNFMLYSAFLTGDWKLDENLTLSAGYAHAMRAPTMTELYAAGPFVGVLQQGTDRLIGDPRLDPETVNQIDLGLRANYGWFKGSVTGYYAFVNNYITYDQIKHGAGINQLVVTNTDLATLAGFESFGQVEATPWLSVFGTMSYVQGVDRTHRDNSRPDNIASSRRNDPATQQYSSETEPLPQIPPFEFRYGFRVHEWLSDPNQAPKWSLEFALRTVMAQDSVAYSLDELPTPGFTVFDIRSYWQARENLLLTAGVENVSNVLYREHLDPRAGNELGVGPFYRIGTNFYFGAQVTY
jgi:iron complex outermembrane recepter protein